MIVFISNFVSPHTIPLSEQLYHSLNGDFLFIETKHMTEERRSLGYINLATKPFVVNYDKFIDNKSKYQDIINQAEVVLASFGSIDNTLLYSRIKSNKLTFLMSERLFKKGIFKLADPKFWKTISFIRKIKNKNFHLLCMGAYVSKDFKLCGFPSDRMWKFGYTTSEPMTQASNGDSSETPKLLWVGRMIWWKKPFDILKACQALKKKGLKFHLEVVGGGKLSEKFVHQLNKCKCDEITFHGLKAGPDVQRMMQESDILLCTSNRLEGWGAVINEGMYNRCVVIANKSMGAAPYLIENGVTGFLYNGGANKLAETIEKAIKSERFHLMGEEAYLFIRNNWSPEVASKALLQLIDNINKAIPVIGNGICTKA